MRKIYDLVDLFSNRIPERVGRFFRTSLYSALRFLVKLRRVKNRVSASIVNTVFVYKIFYPAGLLSKNSRIFFAFFPIALITGFILPSEETYSLLYRAIINNSISITVAWILIGLLFLLNLWLITLVLISQYAFKTQTRIAASIAVFILLGTAALGFAQRLNMELENPSLCELITGESCPGVFALPMHIGTLLMTVFSTFTLFSVVYGLIAGPYMKVNYLRTHTILARAKELIDTLHEQLLVANIVTLGPHIGLIENTLAELHEEIDKQVTFETGSYKDFVEFRLIEPVKGVLNYLVENNLKNNPLGYRNLLSGPEIEEPRMHYKKLQFALDRA